MFKYRLLLLTWASWCCTVLNCVFSVCFYVTNVVLLVLTIAAQPTCLASLQRTPGEHLRYTDLVNAFCQQQTILCPLGRFSAKKGIIWELLLNIKKAWVITSHRNIHPTSDLPGTTRVCPPRCMPVVDTGRWRCRSHRAWSYRSRRGLGTSWGSHWASSWITGGRRCWARQDAGKVGGGRAQMLAV